MTEQTLMITFMVMLTIIVVALLVLNFRLSWLKRETKIEDENRFSEIVKKACKKAIEEYQNENSDPEEVELEVIPSNEYKIEEKKPNKKGK